MIESRQKKSAGFINTVKEIAVLLGIIFIIRTFGFGLYQVPTGSMETTMLVGERFFADKLSYWLREPKRGEIIALNDPLYNYSSNTFKNLFENYVWGASNWTKRIIGLPGDEVEGKIEDGKAVVYVNGKKLDEPYVNTLPLIRVFKKSPQEIYKDVVQELSKAGLRTSDVSAARVYERALLENMTELSYDPAVSYEDQKYYTIKEDLVVRDQEGNKMLIEPNAVVPSEKTDVSGSSKGDRFFDGSDEFHVKLGSDEYWLMGDNRRGSKDSRFIGPVKKNLIHGRIVFRIWSSDSHESWWIMDLIKHPIDFWKRMRWSRFFQVLS